MRPPAVRDPLSSLGFASPVSVPAIRIDHLSGVSISTQYCVEPCLKLRRGQSMSPGGVLYDGGLQVELLLSALPEHHSTVRFS